jgi:hypothetical protein
VAQSHRGLGGIARHHRAAMPKRRSPLAQCEGEIAQARRGRGSEAIGKRGGDGRQRVGRLR